MLKEKRFCKILKKILEDFEPKATHKKNTNMKKEYMKPEQRVVELRHRTQLLTGSGLGRSVTTQGVDEGDEFTIDNTPSSVWGR